MGSLVWLPVDQRMLGRESRQMPYAVVGDKYIQAIKMVAQGEPVLFPLAEPAQIPALLEWVDGVLLTGSPSNIHPSNFNQVVADPDLPLDPLRDGLTLTLVRACVEAGVPLLGLCRGFQEINVAFGGSLYQQVQTLPGMLDHREDPDQPVAQQYGPSHPVVFEAGSVFAHWAGGPQGQVNSLHGQGINQLGQGLHVLGHAPDGLVEAIAVQGAQAFAYAVQWHPEANCQNGGLDAEIFKAFGESCRVRHRNRQLPQGAKRVMDPWRT